MHNNNDKINNNHFLAYLRIIMHTIVILASYVLGVRRLGVADVLAVYTLQCPRTFWARAAAS